MHASVTSGPGGVVLDLIATAESSGNYDAWFGDAEQSRVNLSVLTVDEVRESQQDLVRSSGGSAIVYH